MSKINIPIRRYIFYLTVFVPIVWLLLILMYLHSDGLTNNPTDKLIEFNIEPINMTKIIKKKDNDESKARIIIDKREEIIPPDTDFNGLGEMGESVVIDKNKLLPNDLKKYDEGFEKNAFNSYVSDLISKHRSLPDVRDAGCQQIEYKA